VDATHITHHASRKAVFLDRDGVLNRDSDDFIKTPDELNLLPGAAESVARLNAAGYLCVVITNQSGIARGLFSELDIEPIHTKLRSELSAGGALIDAIYYCPHGPEDGCDCRKPATGMVLRAAREHAIDLSKSWLVGDRPGDIACGAAAGARTILVLTGKSASYDPSRFGPPPTHVCSNVSEAVDAILSDG
jgi:D-glycero-D-manno-heptose 1,7-bisphosphate phosphatase